MAAPKGNEYYLLRNSSGVEPLYKEPERLAEDCNEYFLWALNNPLIEVDFKGKDAIRVEIPKMRPFTLEGLCNYLGICVNTFKKYEKREGFVTVTTQVRQIIDNQQFEGAAAGFLNPNIIARKLGLADKSEQRVFTEQPLFPDTSTD